MSRFIGHTLSTANGIATGVGTVIDAYCTVDLESSKPYTPGTDFTHLYETGQMSWDDYERYRPR
jgi:hypothetical protein